MEALLEVSPGSSFLEQGLTYGFRIGFNQSKPLRAVTDNLSSVKDTNKAPIVNRYLEDEMASGRLRHIVGQATSSVHTSPIGLIPKHSQPGSYRLIVNLSSPVGFSVNDGIDLPLCSLSYTSVGQAAAMVAGLGRGALMAKLDLHVKAAYRMVPVHPGDQSLLAIRWQG